MSWYICAVKSLCTDFSILFFLELRTLPLLLTLTLYHFLFFFLFNSELYHFLGQLLGACVRRHHSEKSCLACLVCAGTILKSHCIMALYSKCTRALTCENLSSKKEKLAVDFQPLVWRYVCISLSLSTHTHTHTYTHTHTHTHVDFQPLVWRYVWCVSLVGLFCRYTRYLLPLY